VSEVFFSPHPGLSSFESPATGFCRGCTLSPLRGQEGQIAVGNRESGIFRPGARLKSGSSKDDGDRWFEVGQGYQSFLSGPKGISYGIIEHRGVSVSESPLNSPAS